MKKTLWQTFAAPSALLVLTIVGLVLGVVADGWWDAAAAAALAVPLLAITRSLLRRDSPSGR